MEQLTPKMCHLVCKDIYGGIGKNGTIPWKSVSDLRHFKTETEKYPVLVMGRKTYESLPNLGTNRQLIVVSRNIEPSFNDNVSIVPSLTSAIVLAEDMAIEKNLERYFVIGGMDIYDQTARLADEAWVTIIHCDPVVQPDARYRTNHISTEALLNTPAVDLNKKYLTEDELLQERDRAFLFKYKLKSK